MLVPLKEILELYAALWPLQPEPAAYSLNAALTRPLLAVAQAVRLELAAAPSRLSPLLVLAALLFRTPLVPRGLIAVDVAA